MESVSKATMGSAEDILSVTQFSQLLQKNLESNFDHIWIHGELSGVFYATSGHIYLTIKDPLSQLKVVIYRFVAQKIPFKLHDGLQVNLLVQATCYKPRGDLQLIGKLVEPFGFGSLKLAFEQLRKKLQQEGLFDGAHKLTLP
ncbi:exodeoxyribonuclease VII large subunit, partial [bacterium]|nr:exodeoxyribonuclease VII large subunit [bacterium]